MTSPWYRVAFTLYARVAPFLISEGEAMDAAADWERAIANIGRSLAWAGFGAACEQRGFCEGKAYGVQFVFAVGDALFGKAKP